MCHYLHRRRYVFGIRCPLSCTSLLNAFHPSRRFYVRVRPATVSRLIEKNIATNNTKNGLTMAGPMPPCRWKSFRHHCRNSDLHSIYDRGGLVVSKTLEVLGRFRPPEVPWSTHGFSRFLDENRSYVLFVANVRSVRKLDFVRTRRYFTESTWM